LKNINNFIPNKTNDNNFLSLDSINNTNKNLFLQIHSENQIKFLANNNLKKEFNNTNFKNNQEDQSNKIVKIDSNKQLLKVNNDFKNKGLLIDTYNNQKILNPSFKEIDKNQDLKINSKLDYNRFNLFKNSKTLITGSFLANNSNGTKNKNDKFSEVKLPNIK